MFSSEKVVQISLEDRIKILALSRVYGLGPRIFMRLVRQFGSIGTLTNAKNYYLKKVLNPRISEEIVSKRYLSGIDDYLKRLEKSGISYITVLDSKYPAFLREIHDPPIVLYYIGSYTKRFMNFCLSVVGTRNCTRYGEEITRYIVESLVEKGVVVVSGMAFGIDSIAHDQALKSGGSTVAVLPGRVDISAPRSNFRLYERIKNRGLLLSESPLDQAIVPGLFPSRNRIISGISIGTIVVEAGKRSGALITAYQALEQGREVFAVPGRIFCNKSMGTNMIIKRGEAKLIQSVDDVLEEIEVKIDKKDKKDLNNYSEDEKRVIEELASGSESIDDLARGTGMKISRLLELVSTMEIEGKLAKTERDRYVIMK